VSRADKTSPNAVTLPIPPTDAAYPATKNFPPMSFLHSKSSVYVKKLISKMGSFGIIISMHRRALHLGDRGHYQDLLRNEARH
jgi:hypothetical protein